MRTLLPRSTYAYEYRSQLIYQGESFFEKGREGWKKMEGESFERKKMAVKGGKQRGREER
jgi:hypothetical protein